MTWWQRLWRRDRLEQELGRELQFHLEERISELRRNGLREAEARRQARLEFGGLDSVQEACRDARGTLWVESTLQDLRYSIRNLRRSPAFTLAAIATLALGIGANTAIFQLLDAVRLRSLPVDEPGRMARIQIGSGQAFGVSHYPDNLSYPLFDQIREHQTAFAGVLAWDSGYGTEKIGTGDQARAVPVMRVSGDFFSTLGVPPAAGRLLTPQDDQRGCQAPAVMLSYGFWQSEFGGQSSAIGSRLMVQDQLLEIVGVTPAGFTGPEVGSRFDLALPLCSLAVLHPRDQPPFSRRDYFWLNVMGRLKPGWTLATATAQLQSISPGLMQATLPAGYQRKSLDRYLRFQLAALPGATGVSRLRDDYDRSLWLLLALAGLVLLIACANLANLASARSGAREREFAVRASLGAGRARLMRQSLTESLVLSVAGASAGLYVAALLSRGVVHFLTTPGSTLFLDLTLDRKVLAFIAAVTFATCFLVGLLPALRSSRAEPAAAMKTGGRGLTGAPRRFGYQRLLVVLQVSVSLVLVTGALLFSGSFHHLAALDPGFQAQGLMSANFDVPRQPALLAQLLDEVRAVPQVESAVTTTNFLLGGGSWSLGIKIGSGSSKAESKFTWVSPGYFQTLQTPLLRGRDFTANDRESAPKVAVVNQNFAHRFFPGVDAIGKTFRTAAEPNYPESEYLIVGLIRDTRYFSLQESEPPIAYGAAAQYPPGPAGNHMYIRSRGSLSAVESAVRRRIAAWRPGTGMGFSFLEVQIAGSLVRERLLAALSGFFGVLAALLASIGLYGVLAYQAARRKNEIGVRVALGATRGQIVGLILKESAMLVGPGLVLGLAGSLAAGQAISSLLFGISARDPWRLTAAALALALTAGIGSLLPARRASRLDPMTALRED